MDAERARAYLRDSSRTTAEVADACAEDVARAAAIVAESLRAGGKILVCGNGGSAADAQHLAAEFVGCLTTTHRRPAIPAIALTADTSILTAIGNDFGFEQIFERQVEALGAEGDVLIGISTSGNSLDVLNAMDLAKRRGLLTIALTGASGGKLDGCADVAVRIPSDVTAHIQEAHLAVEHLLAFMVEEVLHGPDPGPVKQVP